MHPREAENLWLLSFMPNAKYAFGINVSIDNVRIILVNLDVDIKYDITINTANIKILI